MKCVICKTGETAPGTATLTFEKEDATVVIKDIPANVCQNCGEEYVDEEHTKKVLDMTEKLAAEGVEFEIRTFEPRPASTP